MNVFGFIRAWVRARLLARFNEIEKCPICGCRVTGGFGLAGGGYGPYRYCERVGCRFWIKRQSED